MARAAASVPHAGWAAGGVLVLPGRASPLDGFGVASEWAGRLTPALPSVG